MPLCLPVVLIAAILAAIFVFRDQHWKVFGDWSLVSSDDVISRGIIYDRNFRELARTSERVSVYARPRDLKNSSATARKLSIVLDLTEEDLLGSFNRDDHQVWLAEDVSQTQEDAVADLALPGIFLHQKQVRYYPEKETAAHLLGFADNDTGLAGVELFYDRLLSQGRVQQRDIPFIDLGDRGKSSGRGQHLVLTIDLKIQNLLEEYIARLAEANDGGRISAVLMEADSGALVSVVQSPSYNPNHFSQYQKKHFSNLFLSSTNLPDSLRRYFYETALSRESLRDGFAIPWSLVAGHVALGRQLRFWDQLGLSGSVMVDLPQDEDLVADSVSGQKQGRGPSDYAMVPALASPVQVLQALGNLLNGGRRVYPHVLARVLDEGSAQEYFYSPVFTEQEGDVVVAPFVSKEAGRLLASQGGMAPLGTSLVSFDDLSYRDTETGNEYLRTKMMVGLLPVDEPELLFLLVVEQPYLDPVTPSAKVRLDPVESASSIVSPILVLQQVRKHLADVMGREKGLESNYQLESVGEQATVTFAPGLEIVKQPMPDLRGKSLRRGLRLLQDKQIKVVLEGSGRIVGQEPSPGTILKGGEVVRLILARDHYLEEPDSRSDVIDRDLTDGRDN